MEATTAIATLVQTQPAHVGESFRDRFQRIFDAAAIGTAICHFDGRILEGNTALARLLGFETGELAGLDPWQFHSGDSSDSRLLAELMHGEREAFTIEKRCRRRSAPEFWGHLTISLARDALGDPAFLIVLLEDATQRKRMEMQLRQAEKMELVGRLTGGIVHDFNNLLTGFLLYCDLLISELEPDHRLRRQVEEIRQAGEHGAALTRQLLAVSRNCAPDRRVVTMNEVVSSAESLLRRLIGEQIELVVALDDTAGMVFADPAELRQIILNLVVNARDATKQGGKIKVTTQAAMFRGSASDTPRPAVSFIVEDNGSGMTAETRAHLFEPFFTTKQPGTGTGLGLATVHRIVSEAGGTIQVSSEPECGTRIEVLLPAHINSPDHSTARSDHAINSADTKRPDFPMTRPEGDSSC